MENLDLPRFETPHLGLGQDINDIEEEKKSANNESCNYESEEKDEVSPNPFDVQSSTGTFNILEYAAKEAPNLLVTLSDDDESEEFQEDLDFDSDDSGP